MEITMLETDNPQNTLIEFSGSLSSEEAQELARGAYKRIAIALGVDESQARERARSMLTDFEFNVLVEETVKARAADRAIRELGISFVLEPSVRSTSPYRSDATYGFKASAYPIPPMRLDLETPIELPAELTEGAHKVKAAWNIKTCAVEGDAEEESTQGQNDNHRTDACGHPASITIPQDLERHIARALRSRLQGTVPALLESAAFARENKAFRRGLEDNDETYREYRIRTGKKPQDVEAELSRNAKRQLHEELALETLFLEKKFEVTPEDEEAALSIMAPGRERALLEELDNAGKLWMLTQKARRVKALSWAIGNLTK